MSLPIANTGIAITNPLVLYRALVATNRITPDPSQHRLAIHLQKLYDRLKDYEPTIEYKHRLDQLAKAVGEPLRDGPSSSLGQRGIWQSLLAQKEARESLALTRTLTSHEAALALDSPKGLMLHGEVGTGKSMLIDLFADCLPNRKKARWHFNTFMLSTLSQLERLRRDRLVRRPRAGNSPDVDDHSLLWLARELITTSPILFLDEFQLPDRAASKIMTGLMTSFFQLGGVLIATSNRMPEELHKAAGMTFAAPPSRVDSLTYRLGLGGGRKNSGGIRSDNELGGFLDVLKARCEVWEMQGSKDYRRQEVDFEPDAATLSRAAGEAEAEPVLYHLDEHQDLQNAPGYAEITKDATSAAPLDTTTPPTPKPTSPKNYLIRPAPTATEVEKTAYATTLSTLIPLLPQSWQPSTLKIYGRTLLLPQTHPETRTLRMTFPTLCGTTAFGPADYISLASTYSTLILTDVPVLSLLQKNEARRFITLLDALYEARCKLLILDAEAGPDDLFFPAKKRNVVGGKGGEQQVEDEHEGGVYAETFSEAYQDVTAPFRPNISSSNPEFKEQEPQPQPEPEVDYTHVRFGDVLAPDALEDDPPNRARRQSQREGERGPIDPDDDVLLRYTIHRGASSSGPGGDRGRGGLDFGRTGAFTGEDEKFAFKRAQSRIWEMCSAKWWARSDEGWHRPLPAEVRKWEGAAAAAAAASSSAIPSQSVFIADQGLVKGAGDGDRSDMEGMGAQRAVDETEDEVLFRHGASPFRVSREPPPKFSWTHVWGTMKWGKKAGAWGKGVEGLEERKEEKRAEREAEGKNGKKVD